MSKKIIYPTSDGIAVIHQVDFSLTIEQIAVKDTPNGVPFLIINESEIPDRSQRDLWTADFTTPDGYGGQT